jgi:hypothetical protein
VHYYIDIKEVVTLAMLAIVSWHTNWIKCLSLKFGYFLWGKHCKWVWNRCWSWSESLRVFFG